MSRTEDAPNLMEHRAQLARDPLPQSQSLDSYNRGDGAAPNIGTFNTELLGV